jgi:hypothetical protein
MYNSESLFSLALNSLALGYGGVIAVRRLVGRSCCEWMVNHEFVSWELKLSTSWRVGREVLRSALIYSHDSMLYLLLYCHSCNLLCTRGNGLSCELKGLL